MKERALLCIIPDQRCCSNHHQGSGVDADFLRPNGTVIEDTAHYSVHVTKGNQIVRLNAGTAGDVIDSGKYCCSSQDLNFDPLCVHMV